MPRINQTVSVDLLAATPATIYNNGNLSTTAVQYPDASSTGFVKMRKIMITNKHAANHVAAAWSAITGSPTFNVAAAGAVSTVEFLTVFPASRAEIILPSNLSLWVIASAGSTPVQVMAFDTVL
jgi:hypothetical protein